MSKSVPEWWKKLSPERKLKYLRRHPRSKYNKNFRNRRLPPRDSDPLTEHPTNQNPTIENHIDNPSDNNISENPTEIHDNLPQQEQENLNEELSPNSEARTEAADNIDPVEASQESQNNMNNEEIQAAEEILNGDIPSDPINREYSRKALSKFVSGVIKAAGVTAIALTITQIPGGAYISTKELLDPVVQQIVAGANWAENKINRQESNKISILDLFAKFIKFYLKKGKFSKATIAKSVKLDKVEAKIIKIMRS